MTAELDKEINDRIAKLYGVGITPNDFLRNNY